MVQSVGRERNLGSGGQDKPEPGIQSAAKTDVLQRFKRHLPSELGGPTKDGQFENEEAAVGYSQNHLAGCRKALRPGVAAFRERQRKDCRESSKDGKGRPIHRGSGRRQDGLPCLEHGLALPLNLRSVISQSTPPTGAYFDPEAARLERSEGGQLASCSASYSGLVTGRLHTNRSQTYAVAFPSTRGRSFRRGTSPSDPTASTALG